MMEFKDIQLRFTFSEFNFLSNKNDVSSSSVNEPPMNPPSTNQDSMASSDKTDDLPF